MFALVAKDNPVGADWLCRWMKYCHLVDDIIDEARWAPESILGCLVMASEVYSHPYYVQHVAALQGPVLLATSEYADSVVWEKAPELWKRQWADVMRHAGNMVIFTVAGLCGGYDHIRKFSAPWMASCFIYHKDRYGTPDEPLIKP